MPNFDLLVRNAMVVDGTGRPGRAADVGVLDGVIKAVGILPADARAAATSMPPASHWSPVSSTSTRTQT